MINLNLSNNNDRSLTNFDSNDNNVSGNNNINTTSSILIADNSNQYENDTIEQTITKVNIKTIQCNEIHINDSIYVSNKYFKLHLGKVGKEQCSIIVLNNISKNKNYLISLLHKLVVMNNIKSNNLLMFQGVSLDKEKDNIYLIFEYVYTNYELKSKTIPKDSPFIFETLLHVITTLVHCSLSHQPLYYLHKDIILYSPDDTFKLLIPFNEFIQFTQDYSSVDTHSKHSIINNENEEVFDRYKSPEVLYTGYSIKSDIWQTGCLALEMFSEYPVWDGLTEEEMDINLKKYFVPKIHSDIPRHMWGILCECLCPYIESRITPSKLLAKYSKHLLRHNLINKDKIRELNDDDKSDLDNEDEVDDNNFSIRKCPIHIGKDAYLFCTYCNEIMCDLCRDTVHIDHKDKDCFYEYLEYVNTARQKTHMFKEKFEKYIIDAKVPEKEKYDTMMNISNEEIEKLYNDQKKKITEQFVYISTLLGQIEKVEIDRLGKYKEYFSNKFNEVFENYSELQKTVKEVNEMIAQRERVFGNFQTLSQRNKENVMKSIIKEDNVLLFKKKKIISHVSSFHKTKDKIDLIKRYFEIFISHYKDNKINDIVKFLEKKTESLAVKYKNENADEIYSSLITEFNLLSLLSSRSYFTQTQKELYLPITNKNELFSYNFEINKYLITIADFSSLPITQFPLYSRYTLLNNVLYINGGYDDVTKSTLPYTFSLDRLHNKLIRHSDMHYGHSAHSLLPIAPNDLIVISGSGIVKCERYIGDKDTWVMLPDINIARQNVTLFYFNKQYVYAFGGVYWDESDKEFKFVDKVERLNLGYGSVQGDSHWKFIEYRCNYEKGNFNLRKSVMSSLSVSTGKCLLVGGAIKFNEYSDECIEFDFEKNEFTLRDDVRLPRKTCFPNKSFMYWGDKAWALDNDGNVIEFDFSKQKFDMIKQNKAIPE